MPFRRHLAEATPLPMHETAYAKLNLALHVRARRADGYHDIETVFAFCEDGDRLEVGESEELELAILGPMAEGLSTTDNLVLRAATSGRAGAAPPRRRPSRRRGRRRSAGACRG